MRQATDARLKLPSESAPTRTEDFDSYVHPLNVVDTLVATPTAARADAEDVELRKSLRMAEASLTREGVTVPVWEGSLYLDAAARIESLAAQNAELRHKLAILMDPDDEPTAGDFPCTR
jgi:hypothetical protein